jgi:hypothetical protein
MANLTDLLRQMGQGSVTRGWGAVAVFSRARLNRLLEQQYIQRFERLTFMPSFVGDAHDDKQPGDRVSVAALELGPPLLSFSNASLFDSKAVLTMNIVAGRCSGLHPGEGTGVATTLSSTFAITEAMGFKLNMEIDLAMVEGEIDRQGKVTLDLAGAVNIHCNLGDDEQRKQFDSFFQASFEALPPDRSVFQLGMLELKGYNRLTPKAFRLATQAAPGAKVRGALNFGDGAVVVLIKLLGNESQGQFPLTGSFPYLIPDDQEGGGDKYSATLVLSHEMRPYLTPGGLEVQNKLRFPGANAFVERERHTPYDLAVFGNISPTATSYHLEPAFVTMKAGTTQRFTLRDGLDQEVTTANWTAVSLRSHSAKGHGSISNGVYTAATVQDMGHEALRVVITATHGDFTASALVQVVIGSMELAPRVAAYPGGANAQPLVLSASMLGGGTPSWALRGAEYGSLVTEGGRALFTADARAGKKALAVQQVEASGAEQRQASLLLVNGQQMLPIDPPVVPALNHTLNVQLEDDSSLLPGLTRRWTVMGGAGSVDEVSGLYTAPAQGESSNVVACEVVRNGVVFATGYSVVEVSEVLAESGWSDLAFFTIEVPGGAENKYGTVLRNGYQQIRLRIRVKTIPKKPGPDPTLNEEEKGSITLVMANGHDIPFLGELQEGIGPDEDEEWYTHKGANRFELAVQQGQEAQVEYTEVFYYLHCRARAGESADIYAKFKASNNSEYRSTDYTDKNDRVDITPLEIPVFDTNNYRFDVVRVTGGSPGVNPSPEPPSDPLTDDLFNLHLRTVDYWRLSYPNTDFETVEFFSDDGKEVNTSTLAWESEQQREKYFSWTGWIFRAPLPKKALVAADADTDKVNFDEAMKEVLVPGDEPDDERLPDIAVVESGAVHGKLIISLHRSNRVPYIPPDGGPRDKLSEDLLVRLIDTKGNPHVRRISFLPRGTTGRRNRLITQER